MAEDGDASGRVIAGRYRVRAPLGAGGMGEVWEAYDERLGGRRVVVKLMLAERDAGLWPPGEAMEIRRERFLREVRTTAAIEHLGIPAVYDAGVDGGRLFVAMQLLHGRELQTVIDETDHDGDPFPVSRAAAIGAQIASVLDEVHRHGVVHRDIKPPNLMLTPGGIVKVLDFGVASLLGSGDNTRLTQAGMTVGTPPYMSPEQSLGNTVGPTSDVYALGCVLYEVLTGRPPFAESESKSHLWHHVHSPPPSVRATRPDVPVGMEALLLAMLAKEPEERPDAAEVYETLLPFGAVPGDVAFPADIAELDPCLPFVRPLGGRLQRSGRRPAPVPAPAPASAPARPSLTVEEIEAATARAEELLDHGLFVEAFDVLQEARERVAQADLADDLALRLASAKYLAGDHTEAAELFGEVGARFTERYGPDDPDARFARYYLAQCRDALGDVTGAVEAFRDVVGAVFEPSDEDAVERHFAALAALLRLYAVSRRPALIGETAETFREAVRRYRPTNAAELLADLDGFLERQKRLFGDGPKE